MGARFTPYAHDKGDFLRVCDFLIRINEKRLVTPGYLWARWAWQFGPYMNMEHLQKIGLLRDGDEIVGLVTYEGDIGEAYFCLDERYNSLKPRLIEYAEDNLRANGGINILLPDGDLEFSQAAAARGFRATAEKSSVARLDFRNLDYSLPEGYRIISFDDASFEADKYYEAIWRGFNNTRERDEREKQSMLKREEFGAAHYDKNLRIIVEAPNGDYAAHCGMWCLPGSLYAYVEPVFAQPEYRRLGLGRAAVIEGARRCQKLGAKYAIVLSSQQFYYSIGFYPLRDETWWTKRV